MFDGRVIGVRLFCDAVANFQTGQEEISLIATPLKLTVKNYVDDEPGWKHIRYSCLKTSVNTNCDKL